MQEQQYTRDITMLETLLKDLIARRDKLKVTIRGFITRLKAARKLHKKRLPKTGLLAKLRLRNRGVRPGLMPR